MVRLITAAGIVASSVLFSPVALADDCRVQNVTDQVTVCQTPGNAQIVATPGASVPQGPLNGMYGPSGNLPPFD